MEIKKAQELGRLVEELKKEEELLEKISRVVTILKIQLSTSSRIETAQFGSDSRQKTIFLDNGTVTNIGKDVKDFIITRCKSRIEEIKAEIKEYD